MSVTSPLNQTGSGGTLDSLIERLMGMERQPLDKLLFQRTEIASRRAAISSVTSLLSTLQSKVADLANLAGISPLYKYTAKTSEGDEVTATAGAGSLPGSYTVAVTQLAAAHAMASNEYVKDDTDISSGSYSFDISVAGTTTRIDVDVNSGDDNETVLNAVADALNNSDADVLASVMITDDSNGKAKLVVRSKDSGTANAIDSITDVTGNLTATLNFLESQAAKNALLTVDTISVISSSNTVEGAIPGVTLNLVDVTSGNVTIDVSGDAEGIKAGLEAFIAAYNGAITEVRTNARADFRGDPIITGLTGMMSRAISPQVTGLGDDNLSTLLELGVTFNLDGTLKLTDTSRFYEAVKQHGVEEIAAIFNTDGETSAGDGIARRLEDLLGEFLSAPQSIGGYDVAGPLSLIGIQLTSRDDRLTRRIQREEERLEKYEYALRQRFARIQDLVSQVAAQNNMVSSMYASIMGEG